MLLVTGAVALSRKLVDEKAKRQEAKQGNLKVGDTDVAKRAFASQASSVNRIEPTVTKRSQSHIRYEEPNDVAATSPDASSPGITSPIPEYRDARHSSRLNVASPVQSERGFQEPLSPNSDGVSTPSDQQSLHPPPYSARARSTSNPLRPSLHSADTDAASMVSFETSSATMRSTNSNGTHALRIKTIGSELKSGFPYHDALFDLNVHPQKWTAFTSQVIDASKLSASDQAATWASATAVALTGAIGTSVMLGRSMTRSAQEKKIKAGLASADSKLGETLKLWNEEYFSPRGVFVHLELSESAMKNPGQQSKALRKSTLMYSKHEDRVRKREERKFVIVVTKLDEDGAPTEALRELEIEEKRAEEQRIEEQPSVVEIGSSYVPAGVQELPGDRVTIPVELSAEGAVTPKKFDPPSGYVEMSSDNTLLLEKMHLEDREYAYEDACYGASYAQPQFAGGYGWPSAQMEKMQLESRDQTPTTYQENYTGTDHSPSQATEKYPPRLETTSSYNRQVPSTHPDSSYANVPRPTSSLDQEASERYGLNSRPPEKTETSTNPYTLQNNTSRDCEGYQQGIGQNAHENPIPQPLSVKTPQGVTLYDGAGWGDDDFA